MIITYLLPLLSVDLIKTSTVRGYKRENSEDNFVHVAARVPLALTGEIDGPEVIRIGIGITAIAAFLRFSGN